MPKKSSKKRPTPKGDGSGVYYVEAVSVDEAKKKAQAMFKAEQAAAKKKKTKRAK